MPKFGPVSLSFVVDEVFPQQNVLSPSLRGGGGLFEIYVDISRWSGPGRIFWLQIQRTKEFFCLLGGSFAKMWLFVHIFSRKKVFCSFKHPRKQFFFFAHGGPYIRLREICSKVTRRDQKLEKARKIAFFKKIFTSSYIFAKIPRKKVNKFLTLSISREKIRPAPPQRLRSRTLRPPVSTKRTHFVDEELPLLNVFKIRRVDRILAQCQKCEKIGKCWTFWPHNCRVLRQMVKNGGYT